MKFYEANLAIYKDSITNMHILEERPDLINNENIVNFDLTMLDDEMIRKGRPYYQIYPQVFEAVSNTTLEVDIEDWKVPFDIFEIRMPQTEVPLIPIMENSSMGVSSIQVFRKFYKRFAIRSDNSFVTYKYVKTNRWNAISIFDPYKNATALKVNLIDYSDPRNDSKYKIALVILRYKSDTRICDTKDNIQVLPSEDGYECFPISSNALETIIKLSLGISLLATGSQKILEYDVLASHLEAYRQMRARNDHAGMQNMEQKARKKGKFGWNVGGLQERRLPLSQNHAELGTSHNGRQHHFSSYRCGHWHIYRIGKGRIKTKIIWVNPTEVRPDLPPRNVTPPEK